MAAKEALTTSASEFAADGELLYDLLRFARDEFRDENGLRLSNVEDMRVQRWIDLLEPMLSPHLGD